MYILCFALCEFILYTCLYFFSFSTADSEIKIIIANVIRHQQFYLADVERSTVLCFIFKLPLCGL